MTPRNRWRLDLAQKALRTAEHHLNEGRMDHFKRSCAFAREMLREFDADDYEAAVADGRVSERKVGS